MSEIIRRPDFAGGGITDEEKAKLDQHAALWIKRIMRTDPIEPAKIIPAIAELYAATDLKRPRIVLVSSPLQGAYVAGAAAWIWYCRKNATHAATDAATDDATDVATDATTNAVTYATTYDATYAATDAATDVAILDATDVAILDATDVAILDATDDATRIATNAATRVATNAATDTATDAATYAATYDATHAATEINQLFARIVRQIAGDGGVKCAQKSWRFKSGGNHWGQFDCYLSAYRDILGLCLPEHEKYAAWESCAIHGSWRYMHDEFCIVSDFPEFIKTDERNLPHCETGPSHRWRDGWELFFWHGVEVPGEWIIDKSTIKPEYLVTWENTEQRRAACEIVGWDTLLTQLNARTIAAHSNPQVGEIVEVDIPEIGTERFLRVMCGTDRQFALPIPPDMDTPENAQRWLNWLPEDMPSIPSIRT